MKQNTSSDNSFVRKFRIGDEAALWLAYYEATRQCNARDYHPELIERWAPRNNDMEEWSTRLIEKRPFVAVVGTTPVGFAELEENGHIDYFYCHPDWQRRGIGSQLLPRVEAEANAMGLNILFAEVSITAKNFFLAKGFRIVKSRKNVIAGHVAPNFEMEKRLDVGSAVSD